MSKVRLGTFSLQSKIILLVILIVTIALSISTYLNVRIAAKALEENVKEWGIIVAQGLGAGIRRREVLENPMTFRREVQAVMRFQGSIERVAIFVLRSEGLISIVSTDRTAIRALKGAARDAVRGGKTEAVLRVTEGIRVWGVAVPIWIERKVAGVVGVEASLERADLLVAKQRRKALEIMGMTALVIIGLLGWYFHRNVNHPIQSLMDTMSRAEGGDLEARVDIDRQDETGQLARSFNRMLHRVANFNQELQLKVEQATKELADQYDELKKLNERLFDVQRELNRSDRLAAVGQLAAMVAHEVGTPLHSISGHVQILLQEKQEDEKATHRLRIVESQIARVVEIIHRFLSASGPEERVFEPVDVNVLLKDLFDLVGPAIDQKGVKVSLDLDPSLPWIRGEGGQLQQVCLNLILNAIDAMPQGGGLAVTTRFQAGFRPTMGVPDSRSNLPELSATSLSDKTSEDGRIEIVVSDTGEGVSSEHLSRIFDPFFTTKEIGQGTGLGLAICRRIVKAHGGSIAVSSVIGQGSTFTLLLPAYRG